MLMEFTFINDRLKQDLFESQAMKQENRMQYFHWNIYVHRLRKINAHCTLHTADAEENQYSCKKEANVYTHQCLVKVKRRLAIHISN